MRQVKYYKIQVGLDLSVEKDFLNNPKLYKILVALAQENENLSDVHMAKVCDMSINTYQKWKSELVAVGLLQVRQLHAMAYVYLLGEDAIEADDIKHEEKDYERINKLTLEYLGETLLIDDPNFEDKYPFNLPELSPEDASLYEDILNKYPMPNEKEIL